MGAGHQNQPRGCIASVTVGFRAAGARFGSSEAE